MAVSETADRPLSCFSDEFVARLVQGDPTPNEIKAADEHMDDCARCRRLLAESLIGSNSSTRSGSRQTAIGQQPPKFAVGDLLADRYRIKKFLGRGANGVVYQVHDETLDVVVAVKLLPKASADTVRRLRKEIVLGRRITHPNVCRLYDLGEHEGSHFITMEYLEGETLRQHMARGFLKPWEAWRIVDQIGAALEVAHSHGIIHRDLKPENIIIDRDGKVTVMDFGLAADLDETCHSQQRVGTPAYWAPEQARGEPATFSSDIYSIVVIYCELLDGQRPRWGERPNLLDSGEPFERIAQKGLAVDAADRYQNIAEIRKDLDKAWAEIHRWSQRRSLLVPLALAAAATISIAAAAWSLL